MQARKMFVKMFYSKTFPFYFNLSFNVQFGCRQENKLEQRIQKHKVTSDLILDAIGWDTSQQIKTGILIG